MVEEVNADVTASAENLRQSGNLTGALKTSSSIGKKDQEQAKRASAVRFADGVKDAAEIDLTEERHSQDKSNDDDTGERVVEGMGNDFDRPRNFDETPDDRSLNSEEVKRSIDDEDYVRRSMSDLSGRSAPDSTEMLDREGSMFT